MSFLPPIVGFTLQIRCFGCCRYARTWGDVRSWICFLATAQGRVFFAYRRVICAHERVDLAQWREIWEKIREGARGAAKGVTREIKRLCKGKVESLLGKVKVLTREGSSHRYD